MKFVNELKELITMIPEDVRKQYGWIIAATPAVYFAIDRYYNYKLALAVMNNNYTITSDPQNKLISLQPCSVVN